MAFESADLEECYVPPPEFLEDVKDPLVDLSVTDSTELWLIQWPKNNDPDFDGQELTLKLNHDGNLSSFKGASGKEYDMVSFASQEANATVFLSSSSGTKIAGKISRRVSLVHYPEPHELKQASSSKHLYHKSSSISMTNSSHHVGTPAQSSRPRNTGAASGRTTSSRSSRQKSSLSDVGDQPSQTPKRRHAPKSTTSIDQSAQNSGRGHSAITHSGSSQRSHQGKSNKRKQNED
ncbi:mediator-associated protein 2-like [Humulus lupulus]|uniref:mediator-associated protein 2-like n=1 Tax=Humulus lupulus TaxID=3486 RepID=UPI002B4171B1|nr:mediator-associated protein 2-like [Humulus lupulus]XP_062117733.1 mediator-associated protein 2-like [Humulus lupulus]